jgi:hypothetical protein
MTRSLFKAALVGAALFAASQVLAQGAPQMTRVQGKITAILENQIILTKADDTTAVVALLPTWTVRATKPVTIEDIKPGSYLGTTNYAKPDGTGTSLEVHVSPPGQTGPGVDFVMDAKAGTTMTNGVVGTVTQSANGRVLTVDYGHGTRTITVPPGTPILMSVPGDKSTITVGKSVTITNVTLPTGPAQFIALDK